MVEKNGSESEARKKEKKRLPAKRERRKRDYLYLIILLLSRPSAWRDAMPQHNGNDDEVAVVNVV